MDDLDRQLAKIRARFGGTQHSVAVLLHAIDQTLDQQATIRSPTAYNHAILSTIASCQPDQNTTLIDALYLEAIVICHLPNTILRLNSSHILDLIHPRLAPLLVPNSDSVQIAPPLKSIIAILLPVYLALSPSQLVANGHLPPSPLNIFISALLPLTLAHQPKLRRAAQAAVSKIINSPPPPLLSHPYSLALADFLLAQLPILVANHRAQPQLSLSLLISLVNFSSAFLPHLPIDRLESIIHSLLALPKLNSPFLTTAVFNALEAIFHPATMLDPERIQATLAATVLLEPTDLKALPAWLAALEHGYTTLAPIAPTICAPELAQPGLLARLFALFASPAESVRLAVESLLVAICRYCLPDADIALAAAPSQSPSATRAILALLRDGLSDSHTLALGGTAPLVGVLKALVQRIGRRTGPARRTVPPAAQLLTGHLAQLDALRARRLGIEPIIDDALATTSEVFGPGFLLDQLPLNLDSDTLQGRAWLLTVLRPFNCSLGHFVTTFVPLSSHLFEKKKNLLNQHKQTATTKGDGRFLVQAKVIETLIEQIWRLFPAYCDLPWDLCTAFDKPFAELLSQLIYTTPNLRPSILSGLKHLVEKTISLTSDDRPHPNSNSNQDDDGLYNEFGLKINQDLIHLKSIGPNLISVMLNVFCSSDEEKPIGGIGTDNDDHHQKRMVISGGGKSGNKGFVGECIGSWLQILDPLELDKTYKKVKSKLDQSLISKTSSHRPSSTKKPGSSLDTATVATVEMKKMLDVLTIMLPQLVRRSSSGSDPEQDRIRRLVCDLTSRDVLWTDDGGVQKKVMKLLTVLVELVRAKAQTAVLGDMDGFLERVIGGGGVRKVAGAAKRERAQLVGALVALVPRDKMHLVPSLLTEVVVGCKEANKDTRLASYDALVLLGRRMMEPGARVDWRALVGDGAGDEADVEMAGGQEGLGEASIEEFFKMVAAGLAGSSPHMISATIAALSRILFEFHDSLSDETVSELISTMMIFLNSPNREIAKSAIGMMKVSVISVKKEIIDRHLAELVPGLLRWADEHKNFFKANIQSVVERLMRKFGEMAVERFVSKDEGDGGRKLWNGVKRRQARSKKKKREKERGADGGEEEEEDGVVGASSVAVASRPKLRDAYEEALYGSSDSESEDEPSTRGGGGGGDKEHQKRPAAVENRLVEDGEVEVMDLLSGSARMANVGMVGKEADAARRKEALKKVASRYGRDLETGKIVIDEETGGGGGGGKKSSRSSRKRGCGEVDQDDDEEEEEEVVDGIQKMGIVGGSGGDQAGGSGGGGINKKNKMNKRVKQSLGEEFKAKKASGDVQVGLKGGIKPYGYLPLREVSSGGSGGGKNHHHKKRGAGGGGAGGAKEVDITGKKKGRRGR